MKKLIAFATLTLLSLSADFHDPSITLGIDNRNTDAFYQLNLEIQHQSTFEIDESETMIFHGLSRVKANKTCHHELGVGYRTTYEDFDFGLNLVYAHKYSHSFFNHNLVPGLEVFYSDFMLSVNHYFPIKASVEVRNNLYSFHHVSELTLSYRPSKKYEFSFTPYFNYETKRIGYAGSISAFIFDEIKLTLAPYCKPGIQHGFSLAIGYHFGGAPDQKNQRLSKSHRFFYNRSEKEIKKFTPVSTLTLDPLPVLEPVKPTKNPDPVEPTWWDKVIGVKPKPSDK